jgi:hypothetical protein
MHRRHWRLQFGIFPHAGMEITSSVGSATDVFREADDSVPTTTMGRRLPLATPCTNVCLLPLRTPERLFRFREEFRTPLGVRKSPGTNPRCVVRGLWGFEELRVLRVTGVVLTRLPRTADPTVLPAYQGTGPTPRSIIRPPQHGQGGCGSVSSTGSVGSTTGGTSSSARTRATLALRGVNFGRRSRVNIQRRLTQIYACPNLRRSAGDRRRRQSLYVCPISQRRQCAVLNWSCQAEFPDSAKPTLPG